MKFNLDILQDKAFIFLLKILAVSITWAAISTFILVIIWNSLAIYKLITGGF